MTYDEAMKLLNDLEASLVKKESIYFHVGFVHSILASLMETPDQKTVNLKERIIKQTIKDYNE